MNRFYGKIGFAVCEESDDPEKAGYYENKIVEREYYGDIIRNSRRLTLSSESTNGKIALNNDFSIICDPYAQENFHSIIYVEFMNVKWIVTSVEEEYPRLKLTVGGKYDG